MALLVAVAPAVWAASDSDAMAVPVRKNASKSSDKSESKESAKTKTSSGSGSSAKSESTKKSKTSDSSDKEESAYSAPALKSSALDRLRKSSQLSENDKPSKSTESKAEASPKKSAASIKAESKRETSKVSLEDKSETKSSAKKPESSAKSSSSGNSKSTETDADFAAIKNLQKPSSKSKLDDSGKSDAPDNDTADASEKPKAAADVAADTGSMPPGPEEDNARPIVATVPAPVFNSNSYLPQSEEKRGLLSRIFNRNRQQPASLRPQSSFSSDYATRGDAIMPAVLDGNGINGQDIPIGSEDAYRLASLPSSFRPTDLVQLPIDNCHYRNQLYLRREAYSALVIMINDAARQGLTIKVVSAYRDYGHQMRLYTQAVARGGENQKNVARPGKSEHHLGTTVDLTNDEAHCLSRSFGDTAEGKWLGANAARYGWKMTVMSGNGRRSHNDEPWHLRYLGSSVNSHSATSAIAQTNSQTQRRTILGTVGRLFGLGRN